MCGVQGTLPRTFWSLGRPLPRAHLDSEGAQHNGAEDGVAEDAPKDVALAMDLARIDLVEELHEHEGVEDDSVMLRWRRVQRRISPTVDVEEDLSCKPRVSDLPGSTPSPRHCSSTVPTLQQGSASMGVHKPADPLFKPLA